MISRYVYVYGYYIYVGLFAKNKSFQKSSIYTNQMAVGPFHNLFLWLITTAAAVYHHS